MSKAILREKLVQLRAMKKFARNIERDEMISRRNSWEKDLAHWIRGEGKKY